MKFNQADIRVRLREQTGLHTFVTISRNNRWGKSTQVRLFSEDLELKNIFKNISIDN